MKTLVTLALLALLMTAIMPSAKANDSNRESDTDRIARTLGYVQVGVSAINLIRGLNDSRYEAPATTGSLIPTTATTNGPAVVVMRFEGQNGDIARDETIRFMKTKGYTPLAAADSMGLAQLQQELQLENSQYGSGASAQFRNARYLISGTVQLIGETQTQVGAKAISVEFQQKTVEVTINAYDVTNRAMGSPQVGRATITALTDLDTRILRQNSQWSSLPELDFRQRIWADRSRQAIGQAVANALSNEPMAVVDQPVQQDVVLTLATNGEQSQPATTDTTTTASNSYVAPTAPVAQERVGLTGNLILVIGNRKPMPITILSGKKIYVGDNIYFYHQGRTAGEYQITGIEGNKVFSKIGYETEKPELGDKFTITNL